MTVTRTDYVTQAFGQVANVDLLDIMQGDQLTRLFPQRIAVTYRVHEGRWVFEFAEVNGPRILNSGKRGTKQTRCYIGHEFLEHHPQWIQDFVADNNPSLVGMTRVWAEDQLAYNGESEPMARELTPRERDVLCRLLRDLPAGKANVYPEELALFPDLARALSPRSGPERYKQAAVAHDAAAGLGTEL
jgi:hypothetical protein